MNTFSRDHTTWVVFSHEHTSIAIMLKGTSCKLILVLYIYSRNALLLFSAQFGSFMVPSTYTRNMLGDAPCLGFWPRRTLPVLVKLGHYRPTSVCAHGSSPNHTPIRSGLALIPYFAHGIVLFTLSSTEPLGSVIWYISGHFFQKVIHLGITLTWARLILEFQWKLLLVHQKTHLMS